MKVALIAPPYPLEEAPSPPLGLCYAAAAFESAGAEVRILDYIVSRYTPEKLKKQLDIFQPDIVGANSVTMNFPGAADIISTAKAHNPSIITMMGGPHVSFDADETLKAFPGIDIIFIGEAEHTIREFVEIFDHMEKWHTVKGIAYRENNQIVRTEPRDFIKDIDTLSIPARHLLPMSRYHALGFPVSIITSRGCPNKCIFCQGRRMVGMKVRYRSPELVMDEIEQILSYGFTRINIADDFFTSNKKRVKLFCEELKRRNLDFTWCAFARVDSVNVETLKIMLDAGCDTVSFGIESGNQEMLKRVRKGITLDQAREAVKCCKEVGMRVFASFMVGLPGETPETMEDSKKFAEELDIEYGYHFLAPFPGTTLREDLENYDLEILTDDWNRYDANRSIVKTSQLNPEEIDQFVDDFAKLQQESWKETEKKFKQGKCSEHEQLLIMGYQKMDLMFQLLSNDIIEEFCTYTVEYTDNNHMQGLIDKIWSMFGNEITVMEMEKSFVAEMIKNLINNGYLKFKLFDNNISWYWTHNNNIDELPL